ncbi:hypothetical protein cyc_00822 [Cyclospora cayetanensis]|uniref:Uncharacterized protein n=1 Tax=Cyclospora cayetanensis TaxID=88456 RepID=A0A1D3CT35_9EIME|nr:hypothetical protein cyc_00822 [Cyclospora cayetanensis]
MARVTLLELRQLPFERRGEERQGLIAGYGRQGCSQQGCAPRCRELLLRQQSSSQKLVDAYTRVHRGKLHRQLSLLRVLHV